MCHVGVAGLHGQYDLLRLTGSLLVVEVDSAIDPAISTLLLLDGSGSDEAERPPLELVGVGRCELFGAAKVVGLAYDPVHLGYLLTEGVLESMANKVDCEVRDVDTDPATFQTVGNC